MSNELSLSSLPPRLARALDQVLFYPPPRSSLLAPRSSLFFLPFYSFSSRLLFPFLVSSYVGPPSILMTSCSSRSSRPTWQRSTSRTCCACRSASFFLSAAHDPPEQIEKLRLECEEWQSDYESLFNERKELQATLACVMKDQGASRGEGTRSLDAQTAAEFRSRVECLSDILLALETVMAGLCKDLNHRFAPRVSPSPLLPEASEREEVESES